MASQALYFNKTALRYVMLENRGVSNENKKSPTKSFSLVFILFPFSVAFSEVWDLAGSDK